MMVSPLRFVRALALAAQTPAQKAEEKNELLQQIRTVKTLIKTPKAHKSRITKELSRLEHQLEKVVVLEHQLLRQNKSESNELKNQLKDLRLKLSLVHSGALKHQMDRLLFLIGEVGARVDSYVSMKERHTNHVAGIMQSLKKSTSLAPVSHVEQTLMELEEKYTRLKQRLNEEQSKAFEARLSKLRAGLNRRKLAQLEKHRALVQKTFSQSKKKHTFLSVPSSPLIKQLPLSLPSPEQVRQEEAEEAAHRTPPFMERPPEHRMVFSPLPSISGKTASKAPPTPYFPPPPPTMPRASAFPSPAEATSSPLAPGFDTAAPFEGKEEELLSMLESELFPQQQKPKKTFFQKLFGK